MDDPAAVKTDLNALIKKYDDFIASKLKPSLKKELDERDAIFHSISEYQKLNAQIETIQENNLKELKTMVDLGSQFYAQAHVPDTSYIYVNVGFGFHVQFTLEEAKQFIIKKEAHLQSLADKHTAEADKIRAHIKMALEAMSEILMNRQS
ncbi:Prefoldin subunit-domain-containing protein [Mycotypha africana]|uniref:Prefoldin subunit-domain-containing protein n=1 Tax=Mycotypha africana TaxID=64632 RepID=UPI0023004BCE|nr:Prefoldin subunit-domain-containing protein [Mycotypha africana]KAI8967744.1 Prefoldin subunit-domain-containing protein [Mycotypha africana]